jgi:DNA-binding NarL/FixJ family response regulator
VLTELTAGLSLKVIASNLFISTQAVSTYVCRARRKLGATSRSALLASFAGAASTVDDAALSIRRRATRAEREVYAAILGGESYASIAALRGTSIRTVQHQAHSLFLKLGVNSRFELAAVMLRARLPKPVDEVVWSEP